MELKERGVPVGLLYDSNDRYLKALKRLTGTETSVEELKKILLAIYANPVDSKKQYADI